MYDIQKNIEKSTRRVFRIFFGSRLYMKRNGVSQYNTEMVGVDMTMNLNGKKKFSLFMERDAVVSVRNKLGASSEIGKEAEFDIIGEMANIIAGNALSCDEGVSISPPRRSSGISEEKLLASLHFSSGMGKFRITVEEMAC